MIILNFVIHNNTLPAMTHRLAILYVLLTATIPAALGLDVHCVAGCLEKTISGPEEVRELRLRGSVDASDLFFISRNMPALKMLDLSEAVIAGCRIPGGVAARTWPADVIPESVFAGSAMEEFIFPVYEGVRVGDCAFAGSCLRSVNVPDCVELGFGVFAGCDSLLSVRLGRGVSSGGCIFRDCRMLESVDLGGADTVSAGDFSGCTSLCRLGGTEALVCIGKEAFAGTALEELDLSACALLSQVGDMAFSDMSSLRRAALPQSLTRTGKGLFYACPMLRTLTLADGVDVLPDYFLASAASVERLVLPSRLRTVGNSAMEGMSGLLEIDATGLDAVPATGRDVWRGVSCPSVILLVNPDMEPLFRAAPQWREFDIRSYSHAPELTAENGVRAYFRDYILHVAASDGTISTVEVCTPDGRTHLCVAPYAANAAVDTSSLQGFVFIVRCTKADGSASSFKLKRNN